MHITVSFTIISVFISIRYSGNWVRCKKKHT